MKHVIIRLNHHQIPNNSTVQVIGDSSLIRKSILGGHIELAYDELPEGCVVGGAAELFPNFGWKFGPPWAS